MTVLLIALAWAQLVISMFSVDTPIGNIALINIIVFIGTAIYFKLDKLIWLKERERHDS